VIRDGKRPAVIAITSSGNLSLYTPRVTRGKGHAMNKLLAIAMLGFALVIAAVTAIDVTTLSAATADD
jgi:hypothetical protein